MTEHVSGELHEKTITTIICEWSELHEQER